MKDSCTVSGVIDHPIRIKILNKSSISQELVDIGSQVAYLLKRLTMVVILCFLHYYRIPFMKAVI